MLAANEAVAHRIEKAGWFSLHRIHEKPTAKALLEFEGVARSFGHSLGIEGGAKTFGRSRRGRDGSRRHRETTVAGDIEISSRDFQRLAERISGRPEERVLSYRMLRAMKQARYSEEARGHFALAVGEYTHFTSPIRRYPDLVVHRILKALLLRGEASPYGRDSQAPMPAEALAEIADHTSVTERRAADAERELLDWKRAKFMEDRLGDEFEGLVVAVSEAGLWVELTGLYVEGLVPAESFPRERFFYHENRRALIGARTKTKYGLGDRVRVRVDRIAWDRLRPEFSCLGRISGTSGTV